MTKQKHNYADRTIHVAAANTTNGFQVLCHSGWRVDRSHSEVMAWVYLMPCQRKRIVLDVPT